jgi:hypothetical protein
VTGDAGLRPHPVLAHAPAPPRDPGALRVETAEDHSGPWQPNWPAGTERRVIARDEATGGSLTLLRFPGGYDRPDEAAIAAAGGPQRFEHHSCHEEIVCLEGEFTFGVPLLYDFSARTYLNHPPYWLHPARQRSPSGALLLVRNSHPVDFGFCDIPHGWDGVEAYLEEEGVRPSPSEAVTRQPLDDLALGAVTEDGRELPGVRGHRLWTDAVLGWETWLLEADGVALAEPSDPGPVGDEWFVLDGGLRVGAPGEEVVLGPYGHVCDRERYPAGGGEVRAVGPTRVLRWVAAGRIAPSAG